jgi:hypothetical protein
LPDGLFSNQKESQFGVNIGGSCYGKSWYIVCPFGLFYGHWKYIMAIWYILWQLGIFFPFLVYWIKINLATLVMGLEIESVQGIGTQGGRVARQF